MSEVILPVGSSQVEQDGVWTTLSVASRCRSGVGEVACATHKTRSLTDATARATHIALVGDHYMFWRCSLHGPEALQQAP